jgi:hypothetical protein
VFHCTAYNSIYTGITAGQGCHELDRLYDITKLCLNNWDAEVWDITTNDSSTALNNSGSSSSAKHRRNAYDSDDDVQLNDDYTNANANNNDDMMSDDIEDDFGSVTVHHTSSTQATQANVTSGSSTQYTGIAATSGSYNTAISSTLGDACALLCTRTLLAICNAYEDSLNMTVALILTAYSRFDNTAGRIAAAYELARVVNTVTDVNGIQLYSNSVIGHQVHENLILKTVSTHHDLQAFAAAIHHNIVCCTYL